MTDEAKKLSEKSRYEFADLCAITRILRSEGGCPWDREQTHRSVRSCMIEEAYEVVEAIDREDAVLLREELGDVLFQSVFHSQIEAERGEFDIGDVVNDICVKMIHRHPHVFGDPGSAGETVTPDGALAGWEKIKAEEKKRTTLSSRLRAVPAMLPALMRAQKVAKKAGLCEGVTAEELAASVARKLPALEKGDNGALGEVLMDLCRLAAVRNGSAEEALGQATERVIREAEEQEKMKISCKSPCKTGNNVIQ